MVTKAPVYGRRPPPSSADDPLFAWKPRSPFKRGLASDIVLGGLPPENKQSFYISTCSRSFPANRGGKTLTEAAQLEESVKPAGKPVGINIASKITRNVVFGDSAKHYASTYETVTASNFIPIKNFKRVLADPLKEQLPGNPWNTRLDTLMSAAHVGTKRKMNMPTDDKVFKSFATTNQDAFLEIPDANISARESFNTKEILSAVSHKSSIPNGDLVQQRSYKTVASTSFVDHSSDLNFYKAHAPTPASFISRHSDSIADMYLTTSGRTYRGWDTTHRDPLIDTRGKRGKSSIAFGIPLKDYIPPARFNPKSNASSTP